MTLAGLRWFDVTLDTPLRSIGWTYVVLLLTLLVVAGLVRWLVRDWRDLGRGEGDYTPRGES